MSECSLIGIWVAIHDGMRLHRSPHHCSHVVLSRATDSAL